ncbi:hypothetical protein BDF14DRAFT_1863983 [Spinellus fusiger]|nr:hypothetical protein BDF14DRAFT_1863983 [Spinellus fusiger]
MTTISKQELYQTLVQYQPKEEEKRAIKSSVFQLVTFISLGTASLGMSAHLWSKSRTHAGNRGSRVITLGK